MQADTALTPCPFCGGCAVHFHYSGSACVGCKDCIAYLGGEESDLKPDALAEAWNRRAPTPAPTDEEIWREWELILATSNPTAGTAAIKLARTAIAKWGAPAPASFPVRITALLRDVADRNGTETKGPWEDVFGEPLQDDADAALAWIAAPPAQEARVPLGTGQIEQGHDAADIAPTDATIGTFTDGVRFAEKHHGITAAQQKEAP